jgi:hypothetical protein
MRLKLNHTKDARNLRVSQVLPWWLAGCLAIVLCATGLQAQNLPTPAIPYSALAPTTVTSNRFLFIVDTSAGMRSHVNDLVQAVLKVVRTSASGQMHSGDTIGVWTFNNDLYAGSIPLQTWAPEDAEEIALRTGEFLRQQRYEKNSRFDLMLSAMSEVVKKSDKVLLTIFIMSDGKSPMKGTRFDQEINLQYLQCAKDMGRNPMPVVTVLEAKAGKVIAYTVNALPWPIVVPELDYSLPPVVAKAPAALATNAAAPVRQQQPPAKPAAPAAPQPTVATVPPATVVQPLATVPPPVAAPAAVPVAPPVTAVAPPPVMTAPVAAPRPAETLPVPVVNPLAQPASKPVDTQPAVAALPPVAPAAAPRSVPAAAPAPASAAPVNTATKPTEIAKADSKATAADKTPAPDSVSMQAVALFQHYFEGPRKFYFIGGGGALVLALVLLLMLVVRRSRRPERISLITQTMNDQQG